MDSKMNINTFKAEIIAAVRSVQDVQALTNRSFLLGIHSLTPAGIEILQLAANNLEPTAIYCEVTDYPNFALAQILTDQPEMMAYSVIDRATDLSSASMDEFMNYLLANHLADRVLLCPQSATDFFQDLQELEAEDKISLFFYDAAHDYQTQFSTLLQISHFLDNQALIIINQNHWSGAKQATSDFLQLHPKSEIYFDGTSESELLNWNGLQVIAWRQNEAGGDNQIPCIPESNIENSIIRHQQEQQYLLQNWVQHLENCIESNHLETALRICQLLIHWQPTNSGIWLQQTWLLFQMGAIDAANTAAIQTQKLAVAQKAVTILKELGVLLREKGSFYPAESTLKALSELTPEDDLVYRELGYLYLMTNQFKYAEEMYQKAFAIKASEEACYRYITCLIDSGQIDQALQEGVKLIRQFPESIRLKIKIYLALPIMYQHYNEIIPQRLQFTQNLNQLIHEIQCETKEQRENIIYGLGFSTNFYLGYQSQNDRELQKVYGDWVSHILGAQYPQWSKNPVLPIITSRDRIKVGYVSRFLYSHTISRLFHSWISGIDKKKFEVFVYYLDAIEDSSVQHFRSVSDHFMSLTDSFELSAQKIRADDLHVLVYIDFGMDPKITLLAALQLAPIQCLAWGHPITSGLPTIDYFLSSELMEPANAKEHYTEKLVLLPNLSINFPQPHIPEIKYSRSEVLPSLSDIDIVYLSCQSLYKYLPQYDFVFPAIAQRVQQAKFIFLSLSAATPTGIFIHRLQSAFAAVGLNYEHHCLVLPRQTRDAYFALNQVSDIYLDTFAWSGGNTTFEAVACGLPIVTCPGEFMRGRHTYGILQMLGVTETIAEDEQGYVDIAVRLGLDPVWRQQIAEAVRQNQHRVFNDPTCITALEAFYEQVVRKTDCMPDT